MTARSNTGETPISYTYGTETVLPLEILTGSLCVTNFEANANETK